jgi:hypothetical protein
MGPVWGLDVETEDRQEKVYGYSHNSSLAMLMAMAKAFVTWINFRDPFLDVWTRGAFREEENKSDEKNS